MKNSSSTPHNSRTAAPILLLAALCLILPWSEAKGGILEVFKNGPESHPEPGAWQRVAFIGQAEIKETHGKVEQLTGIEEWTEVDPGTILQPGDMIRSHPGATALLQMRASGSLVNVTSATVVRLTAIESGWDEAALTGQEKLEGFSVRGVRGKAFFQAGEDGWKPVKVSVVLPPSTMIRTASGSSLDLFDTRTGRFVRVGGSTQARLNHTATASRRYADPTLAISSGAQ